MDKGEVERLLAYNQWATTRIFRAAMHLDTAQFVTALDGHPASVRDILVHMLNAERIWRVRFETNDSPEPLDAARFPTADALRAVFEDEQPAMRRTVAVMDDTAIDATIVFRRTSGAHSAPMVRWDALFQLLMHGIAHRSEVAAILTAYGQSPGDLDFLVFLRER